MPVIPRPPALIELPMTPFVNVPPLCPLTLPLLIRGKTSMPADCANATEPESANVDANSIVVSFMTCVLSN
jgi:hypothetical protein